MRDNQWLVKRFQTLREAHFPDIVLVNEIIIGFGRNSKTRLGSIALRRKGREKRRLLKTEIKNLSKETAVSIITLSGHLREEAVPEEVLDAVIAHEFCHYLHGFNSVREQNFAHPHKGGIIDKEMVARGLGETLRLQKKWLKEEWREYVGKLK